MPSTTGAEVAGRIPLAFERLSETGHFAPLERPEWVVALVREALDYLPRLDATGRR